MAAIMSGNSGGAFKRSEGSLAFESHWRSLARDGLIPPRTSFNPARAGRSLSNLILVEAPSSERRSLRFRVAGGALETKVGRDVTGRDYLDFLPTEQHAEALEAARLICTQPCGIWQINPVHYERGFTQLVEATIFPLGPGADSVPLMLGKLEFLGGPVELLPVVDKATSAETSSTFRFIDIGAGVPTLRV
ncbi:MAG: PAS domain-containing protein [Alphaproteobacteria bacterium]|nr:PAS domain-containing protein [Alphaproteobacteria bacterium]